MARRRKKRGSGSVNIGAVGAINNWRGKRAGSTSWHWQPTSKKVSEKKMRQLLDAPLQERPSNLAKRILRLQACPICNFKLDDSNRLSAHLNHSLTCREALEF